MMNHILRDGKIDGTPALLDPGYIMQQSGGSMPWFVDRLIPKSGLCVLFGNRGSGKTKVAISLAVAAANGWAWCGRTVNHGKTCGVAIVALENAIGAAADVMQYGDGIKHPGITAVPPMHWASPRRWIEEMGCPRLIVIDNWSVLADCRGIADVAGAVKFLSELASSCAQTETTVVMIAHARKHGPDESGVSLGRMADTMIPISLSTREPGKLDVLLGVADDELAKFRHGAPPTNDWLLSFRGDADGVRLDSFAEVAHQAAASGRRGRKPVARSKVLDALRAADGKPIDQDAILVATGLKRSTVSQVLIRLINDDDACVAMTQRGRKKLYSLAAS